MRWHQQVPGPLLLQGSFPQRSLGHAGTCATAWPPPAGWWIMGISSSSRKGLSQGCCWRGRPEVCGRKYSRPLATIAVAPASSSCQRLEGKENLKTFIKMLNLCKIKKKVLLFVKEEVAGGVFWCVGIWFQPGLTQLCSTNPIVGGWILSAQLGVSHHPMVSHTIP